MFYMQIIDAIQWTGKNLSDVKEWAAKYNFETVFEYESTFGSLLKLKSVFSQLSYFVEIDHWVFVANNRTSLHVMSDATFKENYSSLLPQHEK